MSRRPISTIVGGMDLAQKRGVPGARMWSESPINQHWSRVGAAGEEAQPSTCECWSIPEAVLPHSSPDIKFISGEWFTTCLPEYYNFYGNDTKKGIWNGSAWTATMPAGTTVTVTIDGSPSEVLIQLFAGDTSTQLWLRVMSMDQETRYMITSATICPAALNSNPCTIYPVPEPVNTVFVDFVEVPSNWNIVYFQVDAAPSEVWVTFTYLETYFFYAEASFDALAGEWYVYVDILGGTSANVYLNDAESFGEQLNLLNYVRVCPTDPPAGIE